MNAVFHPVYCFWGTKKASDNKFWYETTVSLNSLYDCINPSNVGTANGRPDSRTSDKIYNGGEGGLGQLGYCYAIDKIDLDIESDVINSFSGFESGVEEIGFFGTVTNKVSVGVNKYEYAFSSSQVNSSIPPIGYYTNDYSIGYIIGNGNIVELSEIRRNATSSVYSRLDDGSKINVGNIVYVTLINKNKSKTHLTKGTALTTDLIGNPTNYPSFLKNTLASGNSVHINPLLANQDGTTAIPQGVGGQTITGSRKSIISYASPFTTNSGATWSADSTVRLYGITNSFTANYSIANVFICPYVSSNKPAVQSTPKQVVKVQNKVVASNSHSIYKGAMVTNAVTGKVAVGNGTNGLESKVLENVAGNIVIPTHPLDSTSVTFGTLYPNVRIGVPLNITTRGEQGLVYKYIGTGTSGTLDPNTYSSFSATSLWQLVGSYTTPSHSTVTLDNSNSPASKYFTALSLDGNEYCLDIYGKEMVWDYSKDSSTEFVDITEATNLDTQYTTNRYINVTTAGRFEGYWEILRDIGAVTLADDNWFELNGYMYNETTGNGIKWMKRWDGNGFGDNDKFDQLTNGTKTDLNSKVVSTYHGSYRTGIFKK